MKSEIEYRSFNLYSEIAKKTGCTIEQIETVYSWYSSNIIKDVIEKPTCQVFLKGLGMLQINLPSSISILKRGIFNLTNILNQFNHDKAEKYVNKVFLLKTVNRLISASTTLKQRIELLKERGVLEEKYYINRITNLETLTNQLNQLYESIQRISGDDQKGIEESGQSSTWYDEQDSEQFQIVES